MRRVGRREAAAGGGEVAEEDRLEPLLGLRARTEDDEEAALRDPVVQGFLEGDRVEAGVDGGGTDNNRVVVREGRHVVPGVEGPLRVDELGREVRSDGV